MNGLVTRHHSTRRPVAQGAKKIIEAQLQDSISARRSTTEVLNKVLGVLK